MVKNNIANITGYRGESLIRSLLSTVAVVTKSECDVGLDFFCWLHDDPSITFYVQAKASLTPRYTAFSIASHPIRCETIERFWLRLPSPVFIFMSDIPRNKVYYIIVNSDTYQRRIGSKEHTFSIPLVHEITVENIGKFVLDVANNQPNKGTPKERELFLQKHYSENPELYHNLDEDERFLEIMRGSDQHTQVEVKTILKQRFESGTPVSRTIRDGLISIFKNCKDVTTQIHVLDTLVYINERLVIPEIIKQVDRNIRRYDYLSSGGAHDIDFLFQGLVKFKAVGVGNDLNRFLSNRDSNILRSAARTSGELRLKRTVPNLLNLLSHSDENVRRDASRALSLMMNNTIVSKLKLMLRKPASPLQLDGVIRTFAEIQNSQLAPVIADFATNPNSLVREAAVYCLGKIDPKTNIHLLVSMMNDDDFKVREQAKQSVSQCIYRPESEEYMPQKTPERTFSSTEIEQIALPMLREAYSKGRIPQTDAFLHFCKGELSIPTLLEIYFDEKSHQKEFKYYDQTGNLYVQYIDFKVNVLEILKKRSIPKVEADIIRRLESGDSDLDVKYIIAAGEMKLQKAFIPLSKLFLVKKQPNIGWIRSALLSIDPDRAKPFACDVLKTNDSLDIVMSCFEILYSVMRDKGITKDVEDLIKSIIVRLARRRNVRADVRFQMWVKIFNVTEVIPLFMKDLRADKIEVNMDILKMMRNPEGRNLVISKLPSLDASSKNILLQWLGSICDLQSIDAIRAYVDDTDPDVSRMAQNIIQKSQKVA